MMPVTILHCFACSALFESHAPEIDQPCPRCAEDCMRTAVIHQPDGYVLSDPNCPHIHTAAWVVNDLGYLYCSICRKEKE